MLRCVLAITLLATPAVEAGWWNFFWGKDSPDQGKVVVISSRPEMAQLVEELIAQATVVHGDCLATASIWEALPDYTIGQGEGKLWPAVEKFVGESLDVGSLDLVVERYYNPGDVSEGVTGDPIFFVRDAPTDRLLAVVKAYRGIKGFARELCAYNLLRSRGLEKSGIAIPLAAARVSTSEQQYALIANSAAPGSCITQHIKHVGYAEPGSPKREEMIELLKIAVARTAEALAELHTSGLHLEGEIGETFWEVDDLWISRFFYELERSPDLTRVSIDEFRNFFNELIEAVRVGPHRVAYVHSDAHTGNFLYDPVNDQLTIIDTEGVCRSIRDDGLPQGPPEYDYVWADLFLEGAGAFYGLNREERKAVVGAFRNAYESYPGMGSLSPEVLTYHRSVFWASTMAAYRSPGAGYTEEMDDQMQAFINIAMRELEKDHAWYAANREVEVVSREREVIAVSPEVRALLLQLRDRKGIRRTLQN